MSKKTAANPFQALEEEAYHAFREWPVWLVLRERELDAHLWRSTRQMLRTLAQNLSSSAAIRRWIKEASNV